MAERTIRRRNRTDSVAVERVGEPTPNDIGESIADSQPDTIEPDGTDNQPTIDDYIVDEPVSGNGENFVDPATGSGSSTESSSGRKRRSDAGTRRGTRARRATATETTSSVANLLFTIHFGLSTMLHSDVIAISEDESKELAKAVTNVSQLYDIPVIGEKALAWTNLAMVAGKIYAPRFVAAKITRKKKAPNVVQINAEFQQPQSGTK